MIFFEHWGNMAGEYGGEQARRAIVSVAPVNRNFRVSPDRFEVARRARVKLATLGSLLLIAAALPWCFVSFANRLAAVHWTSIILAALVVLGAVVIWRMHATARWWLDDHDNVLKITNDELIIRGTIRIPMNIIVGVWGYRSGRAGSAQRLYFRRWVSDLGANTAVVTVLVSSIAPVIDPHHLMRKFHKGEEVAGRLEIPVGAYLDHATALEDIIGTFAAALAPGRTAEITSNAADYGRAWSGVPSQMGARD